MRKIIFTVSELLATENGQIAYLLGSRNISDKIVKSKKASLKKHGQLIPAVVVDAETALEQNLEIIDAETNKKVTIENAHEYVVVLDGSHRYKAHKELCSEDEEYRGDFYVIYSLNPKLAVAAMLAEINTATNPWKGSDYGRGAKMLNQAVELPLLDFINELTDQGFSLDAASKWATFRGDITSKLLVKAMNGEINSKLKNDKGLERGKKLLHAALSSISKDALKSRTIIDWIIAQYDNTIDEKKHLFTQRMEHFFNNLNRPEAEFIEKAKGERGKSTKEGIICEILNDLYNKKY